jgi:hypothetical protein
MSIGMLGGSAHEGACIVAGVVVVGTCVQRNENGVCGSVECIVARGAECIVARGAECIVARGAECIVARGAE